MDHRTGALHHHLQKPRSGQSYVGSTVRYARQDMRVRSLMLHFELLPVGKKRHQLAACSASKHRLPGPPGLQLV